MNRRLAMVSLCLLALLVVSALPSVVAMTPDNRSYTRAVLTSGVPYTSSLSGTGATQTHTIVVAANAVKMYSVLTCGSADFDLYGRLNAAPTTSTYTWRGYTSGGEEVTYNNPGAGTWYIMVRSYSGSGSYTLTVTITYASAPDPLMNGVPVTGSLAGTGYTKTYTIQVDSNAISMYSVLTCGSADFDLYGRLGAAPTTSTYTWRGYTSGGEEVTYANPGAGTWYIMVRSYSGSGSFTLTVTITYDDGGGGGGGEGDGVVTKWAVIVGISNYEVISDLSYCDEDATDWYYYLKNSMGFSNIRVLGDTNTANYPVYYARATEYNVKASLTWLAGADGDDVVAFITSGHGSGTGTGSSYLCMWDCSSGENGEDGNLYDTELDNYVGALSAGKIFIFVDHCYSGGLIPEIQALSNHAKVYMTTTCTQNGYGYDDSAHQNGAWTYYFLQYGLINHFGSSTSTTMEACFDYSLAAYPYDGGDTPQEYDGNTSVGFTL